MKRTILLAVLVGVVVGISIDVFGYGVQSLVKNQLNSDGGKVLNYIVSGKSAQAYSYVSSDYAKVQEKAEFSKQLEGLKSDAAKVTRSGSAISGDIGTYTASVSGLNPAKNGQTSGLFILKFKRDLLSWKLVSVVVH